MVVLQPGPSSAGAGCCCHGTSHAHGQDATGARSRVPNARDAQAWVGLSPDAFNGSKNAQDCGLRRRDSCAAAPGREVSPDGHRTAGGGHGPDGLPDEDGKVSIGQRSIGQVAGRPISGTDIVAGQLRPAENTLESSYVYTGHCVGSKDHNPLHAISQTVTVTGRVQVAQMTATPHPQPLSRADRANGITAQGWVAIDFVTRYNNTGNWSRYYDDEYKVNYTDQDGKPRFEAVPGEGQVPAFAFYASIRAQRHPADAPC